MKKHKRISIIIIFVVVFFSQIALADTAFSRTYSGFETNGVQAVISDNGYYISCIDRTQTHFGIMWLIRTDMDGNTLWVKPFYENYNESRDIESGAYLLTTSDDGCIIAGYSEPRATGANTDVCLVKVDLNGMIEWEIIYGENDDNVYQTTGIASSENEFLVAFSHYYTNSFFVKYDYLGNFLWQSEPLKEDYYIEAITSGLNDSFVATGKTGYGLESWILKIDNSNEMEYINLPETSRIGYSVSMVVIPDSGYAICGETENNEAFLTIIDLQGNEIWNYTSEHENTSRATDITVTANGMFALTGVDRINNHTTGWLALFDKTGDLQWKRSYTSSDFTAIKSVEQLNDGGFVLCGTTSLDNNSSAWFVRTDEFGLIFGAEEFPNLATENVELKSF